MEKISKEEFLREQVNYLISSFESYSEPKLRMPSNSFIEKTINEILEKHQNWLKKTALIGIQKAILLLAKDLNISVSDDGYGNAEINFSGGIKLDF